MRVIIMALLTATITLAASGQAHARKMCFGTDEDLRTVGKVKLKGPNGEALNLARMIKMDCLLLPYTVTDAGYVLAQDDDKTYYSLTPEQIKQYQADGSLPNPLPPYELSTLDHVFGHSLWILIAVLTAWFAIDHFRTTSDDDGETPA